MKFLHSMIALITLIFVTGSFITVGMELKTKTANITSNIIEAKNKYNNERNSNFASPQMDENDSRVQKESLNQSKATYKLKLESLIQPTSRSKNKTNS